MAHHLRANGVEFNVPPALEEVRIAINWDRLVPPLPEVPDRVIPLIEPDCVCESEVVHEPGERTLSRDSMRKWTWFVMRT